MKEWYNSLKTKESQPVGNEQDRIYVCMAEITESRARESHYPCGIATTIVYEWITED